MPGPRNAGFVSAVFADPFSSFDARARCCKGPHASLPCLDWPAAPACITSSSILCMFPIAVRKVRQEVWSGGSPFASTYVCLLAWWSCSPSKFFLHFGTVLFHRKHLSILVSLSQRKHLSVVVSLFQRKHLLSILVSLSQLRR